MQIKYKGDENFEIKAKELEITLSEKVTINDFTFPGPGEYEKSDEHWTVKIRLAVAMGVATLVGSMLPVLPFFYLARTPALVVACGLCVLVGAWIGFEKRAGLAGFVKTYAILLGAIGLTLAVVAAIPSSA